MNRSTINIVFTALAACITAAGCAQKVESDAHAEAKLYFDSWMQVHYPQLEKTGLGIYIIPELDDITEEGKLEPVADSQYVYVSYTARNLEGSVTEYTEEETARMLGDYVKGSNKYYGPKVMRRSSGFMYAGVNEMFTGMGKGDSRTAIIPGWLMTYNWLGSEQEFVENSSGTNSIYEVKVIDPIDNIEKWQIDSIGRFLSGGYIDNDLGYLSKDMGQYLSDNNMSSAKDSSDFYGFYFIEIEHGEELEKDSSNDDDSSTDSGSDGYNWDESHFFTTSGQNDTTIYINSVGRLLNGTVFDTNVQRVAQDNGLSGGSYTPAAIQWGDDYSSIQMTTDGSSTGSSVIQGFAMTLWRMHPFGKAIGIFYSNLGYGVQGSGEAIPPYSPLMFEIEIVEKPED